MNIDKAATQTDFADLIGTSQPTISRMVSAGILKRGGTVRQWLRDYIADLEAEKEALAGSGDESKEGRAARLALTIATTKLKSSRRGCSCANTKLGRKSSTTGCSGRSKRCCTGKSPPPS